MGVEGVCNDDTLHGMEPAAKRKKVEEVCNDDTLHGMDLDNDGVDGDDPKGHNPNDRRSNDSMMDIGDWVTGSLG